MPHAFHYESDKRIDNMLDKGVIRPSTAHEPAKLSYSAKSLANCVSVWITATLMILHVNAACMNSIVCLLGIREPAETTKLRIVYDAISSRLNLRKTGGILECHGGIQGDLRSYNPGQNICDTS